MARTCAQLLLDSQYKAERASNEQDEDEENNTA